VCPQCGRIRRSQNHQVNVLGQVMSNSVEGVEPCSAHRTRLGLFLSKHEVIDHQRTIRRSEQFAQTNFLDGFVAIVERSWAFKKFVILNCRTLRKLTAQLGNSFTLSHQFNFRLAQLLATGQVFGRLIR